MNPFFLLKRKQTQTVMKNLLFISFLFGINTFSHAKKVKFAVDMTGQTILSTGVHIAGDFQTLAGFPDGDWMSNTTPLTPEVGNPNIYSIVVEIPAFAKYEYKFINGDQFYETEFVPEESRVGYNFNDNRWIYVDSLANDTTYVGAILFSQNAPSGYHLLRFKVNMINETVSSNGVHLASSFQGWNTTNTFLYSFGNDVYEAITYIENTETSCEYKFINGNSTSEYETVPSVCENNGNRQTSFSTHTVVAQVCFSECADCASTATLEEKENIDRTSIFPNPTSDYTIVQFEDQTPKTIIIINALGSTIRSYSCLENNLKIEKETLPQGLYIISIEEQVTHQQSTLKLIIQ